MHILIIVVAFAAACSTRPHETGIADAELCGELRDHLVELRSSETGSIDIAAHRHALAQALGDTFVTSCAASLTVKQAKCALSADSIAAATECDAARASSTTDNR